MINSDDDNDHGYDRPSKSQRKRDMTALQKLGEILVGLPEAQLAKIPLDDLLLDAINLARTLSSHEAKRRQLQYIGRLMREIDPAPIQYAIDTIQSKNLQGKAQFHQVERWRDRLIAEGDTALQVFLTQFPEADKQQLRQLLRKTQQEHPEPGTALFRYLRAIITK